MSATSLTKEIVTDDGAATTDVARYLTFTLNNEAFALNIFNVTEVLAYHQVTPVPMLPDYVRGVINLRGRAVPVIDLAIRFARGATTIGRRTSIIIIHINDQASPYGGRGPQTGGASDDGSGGQDIGILVDAVNKVEEFAADDIEPPPAIGAVIRTDYISGMARREHDFVIVLSADGILSGDDGIAVSALADAVA